MGIAQGKLRIQREKLKFKLKNEHCKDYWHQEGRDGRQGDCKYDSQVEDGIDDFQEDGTDGRHGVGKYDSRVEDVKDDFQQDGKDYYKKGGTRGRRGDSAFVCLVGDVTDDYQEDVTDAYREDGTYDFQEDRTNNYQEDGTHDFQEEGTVDSREDCRDGRCNKKDEASHFYGTHETQVSEGGEADLHKHFDDCKKNPGHTKFVPVNDFNIQHLPVGCYDNDQVEYIKAVAELTVRVCVEMISPKRPEFWPNNNQPYPFYFKRGSDVMRLGTGMVCDVNKWTEEYIKYFNMGTCQCHKCQHSETPSKVWGELRMWTARHVVFDDLEARHTTCRFFYDREDSPMVSLFGWTVRRANTEEDWCRLECVTCDVDLLDKLDKMVGHWRDLWKKVNIKYESSKDKHKLSFIVSHPHGCPKHISVGQWINRFKVNDSKTKYTYTTCTCPGSSGAYVHPLGCDDWYYYDRHVHSGVNSEGINFSGTGRDVL